MQTSRTFIFVALTLGLVAMWAAEATLVKKPSPVQEKLIRTLYDEVLSKESAPISVEQTKVALQRLLAKLEEIDDEGYNEWRSRIQSWLEVADIGRQSCTQEWTKNIDGLIRLNEHYSANVYRFLQDCKRQQEDYCTKVGRL